MIAELAATASPVDPDRSLAIRSHRLWLQWVRKSPGQPYLMGWERKVSRASRKSLTLMLDQESVAQLPPSVLCPHQTVLDQSRGCMQHTGEGEGKGGEGKLRSCFHVCVWGGEVAAKCMVRSVVHVSSRIS
jgi:hypothetical protein